MSAFCSVFVNFQWRKHHNHDIVINNIIFMIMNYAKSYDYVELELCITLILLLLFIV